ncbi:hypothetical protein [Hydrogenophaga sp. SNF1]
MDLHTLLPELVPKAVAWAEVQSERILRCGVSLTPHGIALARGVGVYRPELVRVELVPQLPLPDDPLLQQVALAAGLLGPDMVGLTLGYGIFIVQGHANDRLVSHELRHVHQYETFGSISGFMPVYLAQIAEFGYEAAPLERDAREHEAHAV